MRWPAALLRVSCGIVAVACMPRVLAAQEGCRYADDGNDVLQAITTPQGGRVTHITNPHFLCEDGVEIWADSAVAYSEQAMSHLIGAVRYRDRTRELRAAQARYFTEVGRLQAQGNVRVTNTEDGTVIENGDLVYLRETDFRDDEEMIVTTGPDGIRPRAHVRPGSSNSLPDAEPGPPYTVEGDRILLRGAANFAATGDVRIERDSLFAFGDSAEYQDTSEDLVLVGSARVESGPYTLVGRTVTIARAASDTSEIHARRDALLTGDDIVVNAPHITLHVAGGAVERLVAVPLFAGVPAPGSAAPEAETDSADSARPVALAESFELTADSLELIAPADVVERIVAVGEARSVSRTRDSLNVESLPDFARTDWLEGDTVVIFLKQVADTTLGATGEGGETGYEVERIVARVRARSLYRLPPEDSTAAPGIDPPAVHYVVGDEITLVMEDGEVQSMEVVGQTRGVHLEPLAAPPAPDSVGAGDSIRVAPAPADAGNDFSLADVRGRSPQPTGTPPARDQRPWNRR
jgi:lipopolysaccharide export system protein LptA